MPDRLLGAMVISTALVLGQQGVSKGLQIHLMSTGSKFGPIVEFQIKQPRDLPHEGDPLIWAIREIVIAYKDQTDYHLSALTPGYTL